MQDIHPQSPEERRKRLAQARAKFGSDVVELFRPHHPVWEAIKRIALGVYEDGFIYAGNLAYVAILALFPFFIVATAITGLLGETAAGRETVAAFMEQLPPNVAQVLAAPLQEVLTARTGPLLWIGAVVGLWTTASFIETVRDILRRAYGVPYSRPFWEYRLGSIALIIAAVLVLMTALGASVALASLHHLVVHLMPFSRGLADTLGIYRLAPAGALYFTFYFLFLALTPARYRAVRYRKWPGALLVTAWWLATVELLPETIGLLGGYSLTYGSLAGVMIALLFFFVAGLGVVVGAELNAALAEPRGEALKGEIYSGPFSDQLEVAEPAPGEDVSREEAGGVA
jgi:membrane protein